MSLELYFANLISISGASELVLECDNATPTSSPPSSSRSRQSLLRKRPSINKTNSGKNSGPPNCPLRQESIDNLALAAKNKSKSLRRGRSSSPEKEEEENANTLKAFYNEVAPGFKLSNNMILTMNNNNNNNSNCNKKSLSPTLTTSKGSSSSSSYHHQNLLKSSVMAQVLNMNDICPPTLPRSRSRSRSASPDNASSSSSNSKSICDYLDEVQDLVNMGNSNKNAVVVINNDRRWSGSHVSSSNVTMMKNKNLARDRRWSGSHVSTSSATTTTVA